MNRNISAVLTASALIFGVFLPREEAAAQMAKDLVGTWTLVSVTLEQDGKKTEVYGPAPQGQLIYDQNGHVSLIITRADLPKFAANDRLLGTPEENGAIVQGSLVYFGTYVVDETAKTITSHIDSCTFPNWNGTERKSTFSISGGELQISSTSRPSTGGPGTAYLVWRRAQ